MMGVEKNHRWLGHYERVNVTYGGALECRNGFGSPVELILAAGQWDRAYREGEKE